jgi:hypothetical protein
MNFTKLNVIFDSLERLWAGHAYVTDEKHGAHHSLNCLHIMLSQLLQASWQQEHNITHSEIADNKRCQSLTHVFSSIKLVGSQIGWTLPASCAVAK